MAKKKTAQKSAHASSKPEGALSVPSDYPQLLSALKSRLQTARVQAHLAVNRERTLLYWDIGQMIQGRQDLEGWGSAVIPRLAADLKAAFPEIGGFSERNLKRMIAFYREYPALAEFSPRPVAKLPDSETAPKVPQPAALLLPPLEQSVMGIPWFHNITLIEKVKDLATRQFYAAKTLERGWSRAVLVHQIVDPEKVVEASRLNSPGDQRREASDAFNDAQLHWLQVIKSYIALKGAFATDDQTAYLDAWQSVDSDEGVPLAVAKRVFGEDPKAIIEELNEVLVA